MKVIKSVVSDNLAPILLLDKSLEEMPEPFRMQPNVLFIVKFEEYLIFIDKYLGTVDYLATPTATLKRYRSNNNSTALYMSYLRDMAFGVAKELHYSEEQKHSATMIIHEKNGEECIPFSEVSTMYKDIAMFTENEMHLYMESRGFPIPYKFYGDNYLLWQYANVLLYFSKSPVSPWCFDRKELKYL